jgi:hypothetical protein
MTSMPKLGLLTLTFESARDGSAQKMLPVLLPLSRLVNSDLGLDDAAAQLRPEQPLATNWPRETTSRPFRF